MGVGRIEVAIIRWIDRVRRDRLLASFSFVFTAFAIPTALTWATNDNNKGWLFGVACLASFPIAVGATQMWGKAVDFETRRRVQQAWKSVPPDDLPLRRAAIVTLGREGDQLKDGVPSLIERVLTLRKPAFLALICTTEAAVLPRLPEIVAKHGNPTVRLFPNTGSRLAYSANTIDERPSIAALGWIRSCGVVDGDIVFNVTGGSVPMSLSAHGVATAAGIEVDYIERGTGLISVLARGATS